MKDTYYWVTNDEDQTLILNMNLVKEAYAQELVEDMRYRIVYILTDGTKRYNLENFVSKVEAEEQISTEFQS
jgi:hypothetical protein